MSEVAENIKLESFLEEEFLSHYGDTDDLPTRKEALVHFKGFPVKKDEEYKFTPIAPVLRRHFGKVTINPPSAITAKEVEDHFYNRDGHHIVMVNGTYNEALSHFSEDENIEISSTEALAGCNQVCQPSEDPFVALNTAFVDNVLSIDVKDEKESLPVFIYHILDNTKEDLFLNSRVVIRCGHSSSSLFVSKTILLGEKNTFWNKVTEVDVEKNASSNFTTIQNNPDHLFEIDGLKARQARDSRFYANTFSFRGQLIRNNLNIAIEGENCEAHMHGLYLLDGKSHVDNHTSVDHKKPHSFSNEVYKGIVDGSGRGVFNGKIFVRQDAQKTNAFQSNNNISLSDSATINTKPQLEIWADDVQCSHGCTVGQLDEEAVYYLQTRGIDRRTAVAMLLVAFAEQSFAYLPFEFIREELHEIIDKRLGS